MTKMNVLLFIKFKINICKCTCKFCKAFTVPCYGLDHLSHSQICLSNHWFYKGYANFQLCIMTKCLPEPRILHECPQWWFGDPDSLFYQNTWQLTECNVLALELHIIGGPLHLVCIEVIKLLTGTRFLLWNWDFHPVFQVFHHHFHRISGFSFPLSVFSDNPKDVKIQYIHDIV